jgi:hypothetical protein
VRYRPVVSIRVFGPMRSLLYYGCLDCACDDTIFPMSLARKLDIDLTGAPQGRAYAVGGVITPISFAAVTLRLSDGVEIYEWQATVGFVDLPLRWALLGHAGFLDYFDTELRGARREVVISTNTLFPGTRAVQATWP